MAKNPVTNRAALAALEASPLILTERSAVTALIEAGLLEADPLSEPERIAQLAYEWLGTYSTEHPKDAFDKASGWSTDSWEIVTEEKFDMPQRIKLIFAALVIMAKNAGIEL